MRPQRKIERGRATRREALRPHLRHDRMHPMLDPGLVVAEYGGSISLKTGGRYDNRYVGVFRFDEDGRLSRYAEYFDPVVLSRAFGQDVGQTFGLEEEGSGDA